MVRLNDDENYCGNCFINFVALTFYFFLLPYLFGMSVILIKRYDNAEQS